MSISAKARPSGASAHIERERLFEVYRNRIETNPALSRALVSYQSNRGRPFYRWFKYKEGFSAALVEYVIEHFGVASGTLLDPFAGSGAALFAGRSLGWRTLGVELLPVGTAAIRARVAAEQVDAHAFREHVERFRLADWRRKSDPDLGFRHLPITAGAFAPNTERDIACFRTYVRDRIENPDMRLLFDAACMAVLEAVSFTRKDGQYLRWDTRAPRALPGKRFHKGTIPTFSAAILRQLTMMARDMCMPDLFGLRDPDAPCVELIEGSSLDALPTMAAGRIDLVITSPPYCNRYDYTRTYALELAYLGVDSQRLKDLRQALLSCTVENRAKADDLAAVYESETARKRYAKMMAAFESQRALHEVLAILDGKGRANALNNVNVPRMVRNYFLESAVVVFELARLLKPGGRVVMVNDNVQYAAEEVPVDLILSSFAENAGLIVEHIWTLGRGKGNSSQQMGAHGRNELRKCAYIWRKSA